MTKTKTAPITGFEVVYSDGYTVLVAGVDIAFDAIAAANEATGRQANPFVSLVGGMTVDQFDLVVDRRRPPTINKFGVAVGDIFTCSWGYDETHINFFEVVRVTASKAEVRPIGSKTVDANGPAGNKVVPNPDYTCEYDVLIGVERSDPVKTKLCSVKTGYKGTPTIVLRSGQYWARPWDGKPEYETDTMFGR